MKEMVNKINNRLIHVAPSKTQGVGLFASKDIEENIIIYVIDTINYKPFEIKDLLENGADKDILNNLKKYYYTDETNIHLDVTLNVCMIHYLNHSENSNIFYENGCYITKRKIVKNEELFIDYLENGYHNELSFY